MVSRLMSAGISLLGLVLAGMVVVAAFGTDDLMDAVLSAVGFALGTAAFAFGVATFLIWGVAAVKGDR